MSKENPHPSPESRSSENDREVRERVETLKQKVGELSKTLEHVEETVAEANRCSQP